MHSTWTAYHCCKAVLEFVSGIVSAVSAMLLCCCAVMWHRFEVLGFADWFYNLVVLHNPHPLNPIRGCRKSKRVSLRVGYVAKLHKVLVDPTFSDGVVTYTNRGYQQKQQ